MPPPDTKDWTWVLERPCGQCGYDAASIALTDVGPMIRANAEAWQVALAGPGVGQRREPDVWSVTEYAAHVRDVHRVFAERLSLVVGAEGSPAPTFPDWDQDATAAVERYDLAQPQEVAPELARRAAEVADAYDAVPPRAFGLVGHRSNGSTFTTTTLARYHLHDVVHHLWDVRDGAST